MKQPTNLDEAIEALNNMDSSGTGFLSGMGIRNQWGLWSGSELAQWFYRYDIYHADDMSGIIEESYQRTKKGLPLELDVQIKKYHDHWQKTYGDNHIAELRKPVIEYINKMRDTKIDKVINDKHN